MKKYTSFSSLFGLLFSLTGIIIGIWIANTTDNKDYNYFYIYAAASGFITAKLLAKYFIEKPKKFTHKRLILVSVLSGLLSHYLCWYLIILEMNVRYWILGEHFLSPPVDPLSGLYGVFAIVLWSWLFFAWATILGGILSMYTTKWIYSLK